MPAHEDPFILYEEVILEDPFIHVVLRPLPYDISEHLTRQTVAKVRRGQSGWEYEYKPWTEIEKTEWQYVCIWCGQDCGSDEAMEEHEDECAP